MMDYQSCALCPRGCQVDRTAGQLGFCRCPDKALVAKTMLHLWEEPVLTAGGPSGAVFFSGCTLGCRYCQNRDISFAPVGSPVTAPELRAMFLSLIRQGAENIDLVTPTQFLPTVAQALAEPLSVPVVYNTGGYDRPEALALLEGKVDIYLPDLKYADKSLATTLSRAPDYFPQAQAAILEMFRQRGPIRYQGERVISGVIVRHLILPGQVENSLKVLDWLGQTFAPGEILVSLMSQYTPMGGLAAPYDRVITQQEYEAVLSWMYLNRLEGFTQERTAAEPSFIPSFPGSAR